MAPAGKGTLVSDWGWSRTPAKTLVRRLKPKLWEREAGAPASLRCGGEALCLGHADLQGGTWLGPFCTWALRGHSSWLLASTGGRQYPCIPSAFPQSHSRKAQCQLCQAWWCRVGSQGLREQQRAQWVPEVHRGKDTHCRTSWALVRNSRKSDQRQRNYAQWRETSDFMTLYQCHLLIQS